MLLMAAFVPPLVFAQEPAPRLRGRVSTSSGTVVAGATVVLTAVPSTASRTASTDSAGAYSLTLPENAAEYVLLVTAAGSQTHQRRISWPAGRMEMTIDVTLTPAIAVIAPVRVSATRSRPWRQTGSGMEGVTGLGTNPTDRTIDGVQGALPPELAGDLAAIASTIPGIVLTPNGVSALGLSTESNATMLNGLAAPIGQIPRDAVLTTRYSISPWDPTIGGVSGVRTNVTTSPGSNIATRRTRATFDAPILQFGGGNPRGVSQRYTAGSWSGAADGPIALGRMFYNTAATVSRRVAPTTSLLELNSQTLTQGGVAPDSARRFLDILRSIGVPLSAARGGAPGTAVNGVFMSRIDHAPRATSDSPSPSWWIAGFMSGTKATAPTLSATTTPSFGSSLTTATGALQAAYSRYVGHDYGNLNETSTSLSRSTSRSRPAADLPAGLVSVTSELPDADRAIGQLAFGGNAGARRDMQQWTWETVNTTTMYLGAGSSLAAKLYLESRIDGYSSARAANDLGTFTFSSLGDLAANQPRVFSRSLTRDVVSGHEWGGATALALQARKGRLYWSGGLRLDANAFGGRPVRNGDIERTFGVETQRVPNSAAVSPRLGFTWFSRDQQYTVFTGSLANQIRGEQQIRGGVGLFRDHPSPALLAAALASGAGHSTSITCFGDAVPTPTWAAFAATEASIPNACREAAAAQTDTAPSAILFNRRFRPPQSWRAALGWTGHMSRLHIALDATYSLNQHIPSGIDLNLGALPRFRLADEAGRDVFVAETMIDPASGLASPVGARRSTSFGPVLERVSDLRGSARQIAMQVTPALPWLRYLSMSYTYLDARTQFRGIDGRAAGDPRTVEWGRSAVPRHQVIVQLAQYVTPARAQTGPAIARWFGATAFIRATSGIPFTPLTDGDINGDGRGLDRPFVFDPVRSADTATSRALRVLLSDVPRARRCLTPQFGRIAAINSCAGDWSATMNASLFLFPHRPVDRGPRVHASLTASNVLAGVDALLHGNGQSRGWGSPSAPDPLLFRVRGFDPAKRRFLYEVNGRFGTSTAAIPFRTPMRLTLDVMIDLGRSRAEQELEQNMRLQLPLVGTRAPVDSLKQRYLSRPRTGFFDLYAAMLDLADPLALSRDQVDSLRGRQRVLRRTADSIYTELAAYLHELPKRYDAERALQRVQRASTAMTEALRAEGPFVLRVLTPGQIERLPSGWRALLTPTERVDPE
jgi:hypothetical protein